MGSVALDEIAYTLVALIVLALAVYSYANTTGIAYYVALDAAALCNLTRTFKNETIILIAPKYIILPTYCSGQVIVNENP